MDNYPLDIDSGYVISAPIYLLITNQTCSFCGKSNEVILLATLIEPHEEDETKTLNSNEVFILNYVEALPDELLAPILKINPNYKIEHSFTANSNYYMTTCACGGHYGDFYVTAQTKEIAFMNPTALKIVKLVINGSWEIPCNYSYGALNAELLNAYGQ